LSASPKKPSRRCTCSACRIVGISGYVVRPPQARRKKPRVSAFTSANIDKILALKPDPVLTFSDLQADIAADLIRRGVDVHAFNQRSMADQISRRARTSATAGANPVLKRDRRLSIGVCGRRAARKGGYASIVKLNPRKRLWAPRQFG
jgi:Periplasmic binding protein